ncbi:POK11 protein, partial [Drymodes brunneopygia]|nr:POK11 protein [Drymodes brunneopygia]
PIKWLTDTPVRVEQWPLRREKLHALEQLVDEQLAKGHIAPSNSPWNSPIFIIKKPGKDRWRLLHDLRAINQVMEEMGPLQPALPSPAMLPKGWPIAVIDIKDCFFSIPLNPVDAPRFAFSLPSTKREAPMRRYHWLVLPQGMKNSPVICQWYVSEVPSLVRKAFLKAKILRYMDDVLICAPEKTYLDLTLTEVINAIERAGMEVHPEKIQRTAPWRYLGTRIAETTISPQLLGIQDHPSTLWELHQLCGSINWVRPLLGLTTTELAPLFQLLRGGQALDSPITITPEAEEAINKVLLALTSKRAHRVNPNLPFRFSTLGEVPRYHGLIFQWDEGARDPLLIIEWVFLPHTPSKTISRPQDLVAELITRARHRLRTLTGCDFTYIHFPWKQDKFEEVFQESENLQLALENYTGQIGNQKLKHQLFNSDFHLAPNFVQSKTPIKNALTVFTDGSGSSHKSWDEEVRVVEGSPQIAELAAVVRVFERFEERPVNLVTDSAYVAGVVSRAEHSLLREVPYRKLFGLLARLVELLSHRKHPFYVMHVRSHSGLPGF